MRFAAVVLLRQWTTIDQQRQPDNLPVIAPQVRMSQISVPDRSDA